MTDLDLPKWLYKTYEDAVLVTTRADYEAKVKQGYAETYTLKPEKKK